jgi:hypothetical protein
MHKVFSDIIKGAESFGQLDVSTKIETYCMMMLKERQEWS